MRSDKQKWSLEIPASILAGARVISKTTMQEVGIDFSLNPDVLLEGPNGLVKLPVAEGLLLLLANGWPAPEPMTVGLTQFFLSNGRVVQVYSELAKNHGCSVTKAWPGLAAHALKVAGIADPKQVVFIEHYFHGSFDEPTTCSMDAFYLVEIVWDGDKAVSHEMQFLTA